MVHSMTAFARVEKAGVQGTLSWELRSVNSRYLEPHLRLPESFRDLEGAVREALRQGLSRGKIECTLRFTEESTGKTLQIDRERAAQLVAAAETVAGLIKNPAALNPLEVLAWPGVLVGDASDPQALNADALALFGGWLDVETDAPLRPNLLRFMFRSAAARGLIVDWNDRASRLVAEFRADIGKHAGLPAVAGLIAELAQGSAEFRALWTLQDVVARDGGLRRFQHPAMGELALTQVTMHLAKRHDLKLVVLLP